LVRYVIDTGVFYRRDVLLQLSETDVEIVVPVTVYMERVRQLRAKDLDPGTFVTALVANAFRVESFEPIHAERYATQITDPQRWKRLYRDAMIAGHVGPDDVLWTTNPKDFLAVGLEADQVFGV
jgi:predicted nucleic acid-binding protein